MLIINDEGRTKNLPKVSKSLLKGKTFNNLLVLEDILDLSVLNRSLRYRCICKCLECGRILHNVRSWELKHGEFFCPCTKADNRYKFNQMKGKMLKFLVSERNRAYAEMLFEEDLKRVEGFDMMIHFLHSKSLKKYFLENY